MILIYLCTLSLVFGIVSSASKYFLFCLHYIFLKGLILMGIESSQICITAVPKAASIATIILLRKI